MKAYLGIPSHDGRMCIETQYGLSRCNDLFVDTIYIKSCCFAQLARNSIAHKFLKTDGDRLVFVDTDIYFEREQMERLLSHDKPIVGGLYMSRSFNNGKFLVNPVGRLKQGLQEVNAVATGFMSIHRDVFETLKSTYPDRWYKDDNGDVIYDWFPAGSDLVPHNWMSDDFSFCWLAKQAGISVWCDIGIRLGHIGNMVFGISEKYVESVVMEHA